MGQSLTDHRYLQRAMSFRWLAALHMFWIVEHGCQLYAWMYAGSLSWLRKQKDFTVPREISLISPLPLSHSHHHAYSWGQSSTPCQHFTDPYRQGELNGGGAGILAGGREKEEGAGGLGEGVLGWKQVLWCCTEDNKIDRYSLFWLHTISDYFTAWN